MSEKTSDLELITQTIDHYFQGMYHSDTERLKKAFHPEAYLFGYFQGNFTHVTAWEHTGNPSRPAMHKEALTYEAVELKQRSYK